MWDENIFSLRRKKTVAIVWNYHCLLYTSDAADERSSVDLGGRRIIKKKNKENNSSRRVHSKKDNDYEKNRYVGQVAKTLSTRVVQ